MDADLTINNQIEDLEKAEMKYKEKTERLETAWKSFMRSMGHSNVVISAKIKKVPPHKNVPPGKL